ncbi:MAG: pre-tRNA nuclear export protein [Thelocarpon superellum]|nr:MAG: pre-tRNA nuclear export protein [Thelocarpon superellum]
MEEQVQNAIEIAWNPAADPNLKTQALSFLSQLPRDPSAWRVCLALFTRLPRLSDVVRHVALEVVNNVIQTRQLDEAGMREVKESLMGYVRRVYAGGDSDGGGGVDIVSIQNKFTQTLTYLFTALYPEHWQAFFDDFLALTIPVDGGGPGVGSLAGVVLYLRVTGAVHDEIADILVPHTPDEQKRNTLLKDLVRQRDAARVAQSWLELLSRWQNRNDVVLEMCLKVVGRWVSWIDIGLVINQGMLNLIFPLVGRNVENHAGEGGDPVRSAAIDTLTEVVGKKMQAADKMEMIVFLNLESVVAQLILSPPLNELRTTPQYETDLAETVAKLVNNTVVDIITAVEDASVNEHTHQRAEELLQIFLPHLLRFFTDEYDEICSTVLPALSDLVALLRKQAKARGSLAPRDAAMLPSILNAIILKLRYDETASWGEQDEQTDEAEFQELRKRLQVLQQGVAATDEPLFIRVLETVIFETFSRFEQQQGQGDWRDLDLALHEIFLLGDLAVKHGGLYVKNQPTGPAAERLIEMLKKMIESDIASYSHPAIQLQYMEICVRYCTFFESNPQFIPRVLETFVKLVHHTHPRVKTRSWYLFHRFVKHLRGHLGDVAQTVIEAISDLLVIRSELPKSSRDQEDLSSDDSEQMKDATFTSQLYLFEAVGCMSSVSSVPIERQVFYIKSVSSPLFSDLEQHLGSAKQGDERAALQIHHDIMAFGTLARGFSDWMPRHLAAGTSTPAHGVSEAFEQGAEAILVTLESLKSFVSVRTAARFAFSRLVGVLGTRILGQLPRWIDGLLSQSSSKDEMAMFLRLLDQVVYDFKTEIYNILDSLLTPLLQRVFAGLAEPTSGTDDVIQLAELRREYLNFLLILLNNDLGSVLVSSTNQSGLETLMSTIEHFAKDRTDLPTAKLAYTLLTKMASQWGGPDQAIEDGTNPNWTVAAHTASTTAAAVPTNTATTTTSTTTSTSTSAPTTTTLPGFTEFMITRLSPVCWALASNPDFNPKDAQSRQVLSEAAALQKTIYAKTGPAFVSYLKDVWFPSLQLAAGSDVVEEYLRNLQTRDVRAFRQFFVTFVQQSRR